MKKAEKARKDLIKRILEISFKYRLGHLGSCLSALDILDCIYSIRKVNDPVILSSGHAGLALYVILEKYGFANAEKLFIKHGVHPNRDLQNGIYASTGSLGQGLPIAVGMAIADRKKEVFCIVSDGECAEGSIWEAVRIASEQKLNNLKIVINANGYGGYDEINIKSLPSRLRSFGCSVYEVDGHRREQLYKALQTSSGVRPLAIFAKTRINHLPFLRGLDAHYKVMEESDYFPILKELNK
ncbi:hypothetical protein A3D83_01310 [Candidatus Daviesbacteria bacterium RIFCSPHIGHO2_02_FULL_41_10]|uniref:Transketolase N-terminal domain-containing protein n=1 Tax=Candidatus Daviesbacteria bacterium RIFCSPHIGHO2_02_FULL_41_10 TaxID=1797774 RepID=A0A1F5JYU0_9BACT|nr:MAG: hypothetical protein A3D83_01310 [Candidatus Daviesbacteria bacterium RIFCSPHIGHO2_02_FULL_41_10]